MLIFEKLFLMLLFAPNVETLHATSLLLFLYILGALLFKF
jgi:hypothetical protein